MPTSGLHHHSSQAKFGCQHLLAHWVQVVLYVCHSVVTSFVPGFFEAIKQSYSRKFNVPVEDVSIRLDDATQAPQVSYCSGQNFLTWLLASCVIIVGGSFGEEVKTMCKVHLKDTPTSSGHTYFCFNGDSPLHETRQSGSH